MRHPILAMVACSLELIMKHSLLNNVAKLRFFLETTKEKGENLKQAAIFDDTRKNDICLPWYSKPVAGKCVAYVYSS